MATNYVISTPPAPDAGYEYRDEITGEVTISWTPAPDAERYGEKEHELGYHDEPEPECPLCFPTPDAEDAAEMKPKLVVDDALLEIAYHRASEILLGEDYIDVLLDDNRDGDIAKVTATVDAVIDLVAAAWGGEES